ncbi:hypothetical protein BVX94_00035, partial [bacterium B17]
MAARLLPYKAINNKKIFPATITDFRPGLHQRDERYDFESPSSRSLLKQHKGAEKCSVIIGPPGSGKTSSLQEIMKQRYGEFMSQGMKGSLPVYIDLTTATLPIYETVSRSIGIQLDATYSALDNTGCMLTVLCDGLDRLPCGMSAKKVFDELLSLSRHPTIDNMYIACKRSDWNTSYLDKAHASEVNVLTLCPFSTHPKGEIAEYIRLRFPEASHAVFQSIRSDRRILDMARNPHLLKMICDLVKTNPSNVLPDNRSQLFRQWIKQQLVDAGEGGEDISRIYEVLGKIAFVMMQTGVLEISETSLPSLGVGVLENQHQYYSLLEKAKEARLLCATAHSDSAPYLSFIHQSFQEYFAMCEVQQNDNQGIQAWFEDTASEKKWDELKLLLLEEISKDSISTEHIVLIKWAIHHLFPLSPRLACQAYSRTSLFDLSFEKNVWELWCKVKAISE